MAHAPRDESIKQIHRLADFADLYVVTSRDDSQEQVTRDWLFWHGIGHCFKDVYLTQSKRPVCESIGALSLLDDAEKNIVALQGSSVHPIIFDAPHNQGLRGTRVSNWEQAADEMCALAIK